MWGLCLYFYQLSPSIFMGCMCSDVHWLFIQLILCDVCELWAIISMSSTLCFSLVIFRNHQESWQGVFALGLVWWQVSRFLHTRSCLLMSGLRFLQTSQLSIFYPQPSLTLQDIHTSTCPEYDMSRGKAFRLVNNHHWISNFVILYVMKIGELMPWYLWSFLFFFVFDVPWHQMQCFRGRSTQWWCPYP